jgi:hypothetical protein
VISELRKIPMSIRALAAGVVVAAAVAAGLAFSSAAGASSSPPPRKVLHVAPADTAKKPTCARPGTAGKGNGTGRHATPGSSIKKGGRVEARGVPKAHPSGTPKAHPSGTPKAHPSGTPKAHPSGARKAHPRGAPKAPPRCVPGNTAPALARGK